MTIKFGRVVVVEDGRYTNLDGPGGEPWDPVEFVSQMKLPGDEIFIIDIDGLERNSPDMDSVKRIASITDVWLDAGVGNVDDIMDLFVSDASKVVMGTTNMESLDELREALEMSDDVIFSIGYDGGIVSTEPSLSGKGLESLEGIGEMLQNATGLFFDLGGIRDRKPIDVDAISKLAGRFRELYVCGHVAKTDLPALEAAGVTGILMDFREIGEAPDERA
jgi:uncharacterized protein related to proFAR isomerase